MTKNSTNKKRRVHFDPDNVDIVVEEGASLLETAITAGVHINASCGGAGVCGTCKVLIKEGEVESTRTEKLSDEEYERGFRQACQSRVITDLEVFVPVESRLEVGALARERSADWEISKKVAATSQKLETLATEWTFNPPISKLFLELTPPTLANNVSDLTRLLRGLKERYNLNNLSVDFNVVKKMARVLREGNWKVTVTTLVTEPKTGSNGERSSILTNIEPRDTRRRFYSLAFDIGTTAVRAQLIDLNRGKVQADGIQYNRQISYGGDVITRINYCKQPDGLTTLQQAVVGTMNELINDLLRQFRIKRENIYHIVVAGNTTMMQLLLGLEPEFLRLHPYVPTINIPPLVKANSLGLEVGEHVYLYALPSVASYVGADIVSGIIGTGVYQRRKLTLYVDIGTNGEIVVGNSDWMVSAACSAGPAFEGGGVKHGMIATQGAIEGFEVNPSNLEPTIEVIGNTKPKGICGSGLVNITAKLLEAGGIGQDGKFKTDLPTKRIREGVDGYEYVLCWAPETQINEDIVITEVDLDNLIRAKGAMYAGYKTLIKSVGLASADLEQVIIAGALGSHLDIENAIFIGLFPDIPRDRYIFIGNGSLLGARLTSFSTDMLDAGAKVAGMMTNFELSERTDFNNNYIAALFLPHTNITDFPSVKEKLAKPQKIKLS